MKGKRCQMNKVNTSIPSDVTTTRLTPTSKGILQRLMALKSTNLTDITNTTLWTVAIQDVQYAATLGDYTKNGPTKKKGIFRRNS